MIINYDLSHLIGYIGVFATIILGIWGIYVTLKYRKFVQISFVLRNSIALFDTIVKNLPELAVLYNGLPVTQNLILIEGALVNTGTKDILQTMIEKPICLNLPEDYKWLTAKIISTSNNIEANITVSDPILTINSGLLKLNEYISFQALFQAPHDNNVANIENKLDKIIKFSHRIADMSNIKNIRLSIMEKKEMVLAIPMALFIIIFFAYGAYNIATTKPIMKSIYLFNKSNTETVKVIIDKIENDLYTLKGIDTPFKQTITFDEFYNKRKEIGETPVGLLFNRIVSTIFTILSVFFIIMLVKTLHNYRKNKRLAQIFASK